jgi:hypothetical protein
MARKQRHLCAYLFNWYLTMHSRALIFFCPSIIFLVSNPVCTHEYKGIYILKWDILFESGEV